MNLVSYEYAEGPAIGAIKNNTIIDLTDAGPSLKTVLSTGPLDNLLAVAETREPTVDLDHVVFHQVIPDATRVICVGRNYTNHAKEMGAEAPLHPPLFIRTVQSLVGHNQSIVRPEASNQYDYEGELAIILGRGGRRITEDEAMDYVAGYTCFMDGSIRDFQAHSFTAGKNFDSSGSCGPWLVPAREILDPHSLTLTTRLNGKIQQRASTGEMIFHIPRLIAYISTFTHLEPGDVIATGTPSGVGAAQLPPLWMQPGDVVEVEIEGIGVLVNRVITESQV